MATITTLARAEALIKVDPNLEPNEMEHRMVYAMPSAMPRLVNDLPGWESRWDVEETPMQQLDALFEIFCSGETLMYGRRIKPLNHLGQGVWEMKSGDLRLFGWFPMKDVFIFPVIDLAFRVKMYGLYAGYAGEVVRQRDRLPLDDPKFIAGEDPKDVVSNFSYP